MKMTRAQARKAFAAETASLANKVKYLHELIHDLEHTADCDATDRWAVSYLRNLDRHVGSAINQAQGLLQAQDCEFAFDDMPEPESKS